MHPTAIIYTALIALVGVERCVELAVARHNARIAWSRHAVEFGRRHYPLIVGLHTGLLIGALVEVWMGSAAVPIDVAAAFFVLLLAAQILRWWCIASLGSQWNTRVLIIPGARRVQHGPYRWLQHPNYLAVIVEGVALPLTGGAWITAIVFTVTNLVLLSRRIRVENRALSGLCG